ncbi:MAG TPA: hypothetical protein VFM35_05755 [Candidatus Binatia bacterium]|nr:hypothetical protein [Candidatus Binatia bacterium]
MFQIPIHQVPLITGGKLTFTGPARFRYELDADGTITVNWWFRDNNGKWQPWMTNIFTKVKEGV